MTYMPYCLWGCCRHSGAHVGAAITACEKHVFHPRLSGVVLRAMPRRWRPKHGMKGSRNSIILDCVVSIHCNTSYVIPSRLPHKQSFP